MRTLGVLLWLIGGDTREHLLARRRSGEATKKQMKRDLLPLNFSLNGAKPTRDF